MSKLFYILVIFTIHIYCIAEVEKKVIGNSTLSDLQDAVFYVKQIENYYPLLWEMEHEELKEYSLEESTKEQNNIYFFKINEVKTNGVLNKRMEIAQRQGFFDIMEKTALAPQIDIVDIRKLPEESGNKVMSTLLVCKYIYYLRILRYVEQEEWSKAIHELTVWSDVIFSISLNGTFKKDIERLVEHLLLTYKIPDKEKTYLLNLKEKLKADSGSRSKQ